MSTLSAAAYGNAVYGAASWPTNMGGISHGINAFLTGFSSPLYAGAAESALPARQLGVYYNVTGTPGGFFATRLVASNLIIPARVGPVNAIANLGGGLRPYV